MSLFDYSYGRVRELGGLPRFLKEAVGQIGVNDVFASQELPVRLLEFPDAALPMRDIFALYHRASAITGTPAFGIEASQGATVENRGGFGTYIGQAPNLLEALLRARDVLSYYESGSDLDVRLVGDELIFGYRNVCQEMNGWHHVGAYKISLALDLIRSYVGDDWSPERIETCFSDESFGKSFEDFHSAPTKHGQCHMAIYLQRDLSTMPRPDGTPKQSRVTFADVARIGSKAPANIVDAVENAIGTRLLQGASDIEGTARSMGLGPRTLQRRLKEESITYRQLVTKARVGRAKDLLRERLISLDGISSECGYSSPAHFSRAFKAATGVTPNSFRQCSRSTATNACQGSEE